MILIVIALVAAVVAGGVGYRLGVEQGRDAAWDDAREWEQPENASVSCYLFEANESPAAMCFASDGAEVDVQPISEANTTVYGATNESA
jgi:hypothetical protein